MLAPKQLCQKVNGMMLSTAFDRLMTDYVDFYQQHGADLLVEINPDWQAPIYQQPAANADYCHWQPHIQQQPRGFDDLAAALEQPLHPSVAELYTRWYAADLALSWDQQPLWLIQVHGPEDSERMQANLAGHVLMKRRLRQPITLFIGVAEESDDLLITVDNESGAVGLEYVGKPQHQVLAANLTEFLAHLRPRLVEN
jgi:SecY interacting protein Syd